MTDFEGICLISAMILSLFGVFSIRAYLLSTLACLILVTAAVTSCAMRYDDIVEAEKSKVTMENLNNAPITTRSY